MLADRLKLTADAAYVPVVGFAGLDDHLLRQLLGPEAANSGTGVMLEGTLDYYVTRAWTIGIGGRYWAWNMNTGSLGFDFLAPRVLPSTENARFTTERYGMFVQSSYRFGDPTSFGDPQSSGAAPMLTKAPPVTASRPMNWTGVYIGGHLGGGFSDAQWSDPFGSTAGRFGFSNVAGFGDSTHATGPLAGGQIGADWQTGPLVLGAQADASAAQMSSENTCFSGIGGVDCLHTVNSLGTVTGRVGYAWDRSLAYVKGGGAWTNTTFSLFANTNALTLGTGRHHAQRVGMDGWRRHRIRAHQSLDSGRRIRPYRPTCDHRAVPDRRHDQRADNQSHANDRHLQTRRELQIRPCVDRRDGHPTLIRPGALRPPASEG